MRRKPLRACSVTLETFWSREGMTRMWHEHLSLVKAQAISSSCWRCRNSSVSMSSIILALPSRAVYWRHFSSYRLTRTRSSFPADAHLLYGTQERRAALPKPTTDRYPSLCLWLVDGSGGRDRHPRVRRRGEGPSRPAPKASRR